MNQENWVKKDYQAGLNFIIDHEEEAASNTILATEVDVTILLPSGLPLYGTGFYGIFMLAPIVLFMLIISYFIFIIFSTQSLEIQTQILVAVGGFLLLWALAKALKILTSSRNLFPRKYFSTMGLHGIAANYSNSHFQVTPKLQSNGIRLTPFVLIPLFSYLEFLLVLSKPLSLK